MSSRQRFDRVWNDITHNGQALEIFDATGLIQARRIPGANGSVVGAILRAHEEPHVYGSLRPSLKTLQLITGDGVMASLTDVQTSFFPRQENVLINLVSLERLIPQ